MNFLPDASILNTGWRVKGGIDNYRRLTHCSTIPSSPAGKSSMSKILPFVFIVIMALHVIKPLGWPGLKKRKDFWKIAVAAVLAILIVGASRHAGY
ncbi:hypothetical protein B5P45_07515 [Phyllobacterium zundukense]|uniref:Uncharacterized protein n=2 Tax=Phyllobacterium zundukense TaxID=1867719 RepID=A0A2N9W0P8_9HYPH|nr:hypothetical protein BLM14_00900 [Phyllobacterium zundukense]PIO45316.1 hypothetical protein B5P45_07515 [Phyllobacterium zundukense]